MALGGSTVLECTTFDESTDVQPFTRTFSSSFNKTVSKELALSPLSDLGACTLLARIYLKAKEFQSFVFNRSITREVINKTPCG